MKNKEGNWILASIALGGCYLAGHLLGHFVGKNILEKF